MIRGTTPTLTFTIADQTVDLSAADNVYVTISQYATSITKTGESVTASGNTVSVWLTQAESMRLVDGKTARVQINWTYTDDLTGTKRRAATKAKEITIENQLLGRVIE